MADSTHLTTDQMQALARRWSAAQPIVAAMLGAAVRDPGLVEELVARTAAAAVLKYGSYDEARPFAAWAIGLGRVELKRWRRETARNRLIPEAQVEVRLDERAADAVANVFAEDHARFEAMRKAAAGCVAKLRGRLREVMQLHATEALPPSAIATRLEISDNAAAVALHRARAAVRACMRRALGSGVDEFGGVLDEGERHESV